MKKQTKATQDSTFIAQFSCKSILGRAQVFYRNISGTRRNVYLPAVGSIRVECNKLIDIIELICEQHAVQSLSPQII